MFYNPLTGAMTDDYNNEPAIDSRIIQLQDEQGAWMAYLGDLNEQGDHSAYADACRQFHVWELEEGAELDELRGVMEQG